MLHHFKLSFPFDMLYTFQKYFFQQLSDYVYKPTTITAVLQTSIQHEGTRSSNHSKKDNVGFRSALTKHLTSAHARWYMYNQQVSFTGSNNNDTMLDMLRINVLPQTVEVTITFHGLVIGGGRYGKDRLSVDTHVR